MEKERLIAKIQFFYDMLQHEHDILVFQEDSLTEPSDELIKLVCTYSRLAEEFRKIFEEILYMEKIS